MLKEDINIARKLSGIIRFLLILFVSTLAINASPNNIENQPTTLYIGNVEVTLGDGECIKPSNSTSLNTKRRTSTKNTNQTVRHIHSGTFCWFYAEKNRYTAPLLTSLIEKDIIHLYCVLLI